MSIDEKEIEQIAGRLGDQAADRVDVERVAAGVLERLRAADHLERRRPVWRWLAAAAAIVLVAGGAWLGLRDGTAAPTAQQVAVVPMLDALSDIELAEILDSLTVDAPVSETIVVGLEDLDQGQLEQLLATMEG